MTYNVFGGTLNPTLLYQACLKIFNFQIGYAHALYDLENRVIWILEYIDTIR